MRLAITKVLKSSIVALAEALSPRLLLRIRLRTQPVPPSNERLIQVLCDKERIAIDIGANVGRFAQALKRSSRAVRIFEPNPRLAKLLSRTFAGDDVVEAVALSDETGTVAFRIPSHLHGLSTLEPSNTLSSVPEGVPIVTTNVPTRRLDDYGLSGVAFIKIDVEGHEQSVLAGAVDLLTRERPSLLIEIEERHKPGATTDVPAFLKTIGYLGYFLRGDSLHGVEEFDVARDQNRTDRRDKKTRVKYCNTFVFVDPERSDRLKSMIVGAG